jgi:hypothetical protein
MEITLTKTPPIAPKTLSRGADSGQRSKKPSKTSGSGKGFVIEDDVDDDGELSMKQAA